mgnify:CR=1 FL=1
MNTFACASKMAIRPRSRGHSGGMDMLLSMLGGKGMSGLFKTCLLYTSDAADE